MKANELMIEDWVKADNKFVQVTGLKTVYNDEQFFSIEYYDQEEDSKISCFSNNVLPIPLTAEIMEKNGFDCNNDAKTSINLVYHGCARITEYGEEVLEDGKMIMYVHELQHALRLCGFNDLADNFKV